MRTTEKAYTDAVKAYGSHLNTCPDCTEHYNSLNWTSPNPCATKRELDAEVARTLKEWIAS